MWTSDSLIPGIIWIILAAGFIAFVILSFVNAHRRNTGKEPLFKGKVRNIIIVNKREIDHDFYTENYRASLYARSEPTGNPDGVYRQTSVDFRRVGGKILYTKSINDELFDQLEVGRIYKVRIRDGIIDKLYERLPTVSLEK